MLSWTSGISNKLSQKSKVRPARPTQPSLAKPEPNGAGNDSTETGDSGGFRVLWVSLAALLMLWLSFPPVGLFWLAWIAPFPLIWLCQSDSMPAQRPYWQLFFAGLLYWLGTFYFIPIPHPILWIGWILVSVYMALYTPLFVGVSRTMIHQFRIPGIVAVPVAWTGWEWIRSNFATGMAMVCLSHTQYKYPILIQVADLFGAYTLSFAMMVIAVGATSLFRILISITKGIEGDAVLGDAVKKEGLTIGVSLSSLAAVLVYGSFQLNQPIVYKNESTLEIGLIQTSNDVVFRPLSQHEHMQNLSAKFEQTWAARNQWPDLELVVWPESGFDPNTDLISDDGNGEMVEQIANHRTKVWSNAIGYPAYFPKPIPLLTGGGTIDMENDRHFASAFLIANDGQIETRYFKNHLIMFGEYVPFANWVPFVKSLSPIGGGISAGSTFETITRNDVTIAPSICFETTIPHFIRRQINTLTETGTEPDVMVNMTNDGWFYGTSCLDLHLACNVFRAVEMRKPHLICANTGLSAEIDSCGRLLQTGPRRQPTEIRAEVRPIQRTSMYRRLGDLIPMVFAGIVLLTGLAGSRKK